MTQAQIPNEREDYGFYQQEDNVDLISAQEYLPLHRVRIIRRECQFVALFGFLVFALAMSSSLLLRRENKRRDRFYGKGSGVDAGGLY